MLQLWVSINLLTSTIFHYEIMTFKPNVRKKSTFLPTHIALKCDWKHCSHTLKKIHLWARTKNESLQSQWNLFKKLWAFQRDPELAWKHAQASGWHKQTLSKKLWKHLGKKIHESTFGLRCIAACQLTGTSRGTNSSQETCQKPPEIPDTKECLSPYKSFWKIEPRGTSQLEWAEEWQFLLQGHTLVDT